MHYYLIFFAIVATTFASCSKVIDANPNQLINCAPLAIDPQNVLPSQMSIKTDAIQFVYDAMQLQKGITGILHGLSADSAKKFQFHVYIFTAGRYYCLPSGTTGNNKYDFSVDKTSGYSTVSIYRTQGYLETVDAIKVIGVSINYLKHQEYGLDYSDFASIKANFGL